MELPADVRARLDAHLEAVEEALRTSGRTREQRRGIVDDLEAQITDMLAARSPTPNLADLDAVLKTLDPPTEYREDAPTRASAGAPRPPTPPAIQPPPRVRYSRTAIWGFALILVSLIPIFLTAMVLAFSASANYRRHTSVSDSIIMPVRMATIQVESPDRAVVVASARTHTIQLQSPNHPAAAAASMPGTSAVMGEIQNHMGFTWLPCLALLAAPLALAGTVLGWIAFFQIRASQGMVRGTGLALFDGLFYPVLLPIGLMFVA